MNAISDDTTPMGRKIIEGLKDAVAGDFSRVTIEGVTWVRADRAAPAIDTITHLRELLGDIDSECLLTGHLKERVDEALSDGPVIRAVTVPSEEQTDRNRLADWIDRAEWLEIVELNRGEKQHTALLEATRAQIVAALRGSTPTPFYCPKCKRHKQDGDCAEHYCPMAAPKSPVNDGGGRD